MKRLVSPLALTVLAACSSRTNPNGVLPQRDAALGCAEDLATAQGFVLAPRDNALGATIQQDRREFLRWFPAGHWQDANEIQRISAWIVTSGDSLRVRTEAFVMRKPSSTWGTAPEDVRNLATRIQSSCTTGQAATP